MSVEIHGREFDYESKYKIPKSCPKCGHLKHGGHWYGKLSYNDFYGELRGFCESCGFNFCVPPLDYSK